MKKVVTLFLMSMALLHAETLKEIEQYALEHSIDIQKALLNTQKAKAKKKQHKQQRFGELDLVGTYTHYNASRTYKPLTPQIIQSGEYVYTTKDLFSAGLSYDVALFTGFAQTEDIAIAKLSSKIATIQTKLTKEQIIYNIRSLYLAILAQKEMLQAQQEYIDALKKLYTQIKQEVALGKKAKIDLLKSQSDIQSAIVQKEQIISDIAITKASLSELIGKDIATIEPLDIEVKPIKISVDELLAQANSLTKVQLLELQKQKAHRSIKKISSKNLPQVMFNGYYGYNFGEDENINTWKNENLWQVGINAKWNILDFGVTSAQIQEAKIAQLEADLELQKTLLQLKKQFIEAKSKINLSVAQYQGNFSELLLAKESAKIEKIRYDAAAATLNDLLLATAKEQLVAAKTIQSKYNYQQNIYYLQYLLEKGLQSEK